LGALFADLGQIEGYLEFGKGNWGVEGVGRELTDLMLIFFFNNYISILG
jgi:hypothetical protein